VWDWGGVTFWESNTKHLVSISLGCTQERGPTILHIDHSKERPSSSFEVSAKEKKKKHSHTPLNGMFTYKNRKEAVTGLKFTTTFQFINQAQKVPRKRKPRGLYKGENMRKPRNNFGWVCTRKKQNSPSRVVPP